MTDEITYDDRMSDSDAVLWHIERDPRLRSTIGNVWVMDSMPDMTRLENTLNGAVHKVPRLRQRVIEDPVNLAPPRWVDDPDFDPSYHLRFVACPGAGTVRDVLDYAAPVLMSGFDKDRPLWELHVISGMADGKVATLLKIHHAIADGVGLVNMTGSMVETGPDVERREWPRWEPADALPSVVDLFRDAVVHRAKGAVSIAGRLAGGVARTGLNAVRSPSAEAGSFRSTFSSLGRLLEPATVPMSPTLAARSASTHLDVVEVPLASLKAAGKAAGGTINDAFVAAVAGALARYHDEMGDEVPAVRMNMPINVRTDDTEGHASNHFVPARFEVPLDVADPVERMRMMHQLVGAARSEPAMAHVDTVNTVFSNLGPTVSVALAGGMMKALDLVTSNVPGPPFTVYASGAKVEAMFPFGPLGGAAVNFTMFSYDGTCYVGVNSDTAAVTDPNLLVEYLDKSFAEVCAVA